MVCVQSAATPPLVRALESGAADPVAQGAGETLAVAKEDIAAETAGRWREHHDWIGPKAPRAWLRCRSCSIAG
jgi:hypothetical protein